MGIIVSVFALEFVVLLARRNVWVVPGVPGIVARVASLLSQPAYVFRQKYWIEKYLLHPVKLSAFQFHNIYLGWTNQSNYNKNTCINRLWQLDFFMKPKIFAVRYSHWQTLMKATIPDTPCTTQLQQNLHFSREKDWIWSHSRKPHERFRGCRRHWVDPDGRVRVHTYSGLADWHVINGCSNDNSDSNRTSRW